MDHKEKIIKELEEIAPNLASLKKDMYNTVVHDSYFDDLVSKTIEQERSVAKETQLTPPKRKKYIQLITTIAASIVLLVGVWFIVQDKPQSPVADDTLAEAYLTDNLEEFDEYIIDELSEIGFDEQILDDISDESILTYIEDNLDDLDLAYFYD